MKTYIIGHIKPDTDAVIATLAFKHLFDSMDCWNHPNSVACITHNLNPETQFIFKKFNQTPLQLIKASDIQPKDKIVLVDHNETSQMLAKINPNQITDIFDHHKINLKLSQPIFLTMKAWGSTCTIAHNLMKTHKVSIPKKLAALMLCAIVSDTVGFKSSTTTEVDKNAASKLAKISDIKNIKNLTLEIFKAKSDISTLTNEKIITNDYKIYNFSNKKVFISQLETVEQENLLKNKVSDLLSALTKAKKDQNLDLAFLVISDIIKVNSKILILSNQEKQIAEKAFNKKVSNNILDIGPKLSRKKDIAPAIEKAILS
ncbi:MAG: manganese-dependent inorganic pyrophosphatase [Patescibacteria group bacterium]|nr:manganese-dependent inorganic pyrophosphatase [Patescibacteria group bacterium]